MATKPGNQVTTATRSSSKSELTCSVCLEQFKDPKVLPCCHTFCKQCLQSLVESQQEATETNKSQAQIKSDALSCPECRAEHEIPEGGVDGFLTDFSLAHDLEVAAVVKAKEEKPSCGQCESSDPSVAYCVQCEAFLCEFCSSAHKRMKLCKEHNVFPLDKITASSVLQPSTSTCSKHTKEDIKIYCSTCQQLICQSCVIEEHGSHKFQHIGEAHQEYERNITKLITATKEKLGIYSLDLERIKTIEELLLSNSDCLRKQVNENFDAYVAVLETRRAALLAEIDEGCQADSKKVWAHKEFTETAIADVTASLRFAERACSCTNSVKMISLTKQAIQRLESLNTREHKLNDIHKVAVCTITYQYNTRTKKDLSTLDGIVRPNASLQLLTQSYAQLRGRITIGVNMVNQPINMYRQLDVTPTVTVRYGYSNKSFHDFVISKAGEGWTVVMELICGGKYTVYASVLGYSTNTTINVNGEPRVGSRVRPGPDWSGGVASEGTVNDIQTRSQQQQRGYYGASSWHEISVRWDDGSRGGPYRWGAWNTDTYMKYQIELVPTKD